MQAHSVFILPGLGGSGPAHWQTLWQRSYGYLRVEQAEWERPKLDLWLATLQRAVDESAEGVVFVAHSLACSLVAHFAAQKPSKVLGAFLVSPADVESHRCTPEETRCFSPIPLAPLPFPAHVVASSDDPYVDRARAEYFAENWRAGFTDVGSAGHINASSGLGPWPVGHALFQARLAEWLARRELTR